ncbi:MAG: 50S ribosomal protein L9 [Candidatus Omnitrophota bacterium]|jgi:large subunit ribosomal protein L9
MEIILIKDVEKLGKAGEVVNVKDGFGRNFLIPRGLAVPSNSAALKRLETDKQKRLEDMEKARSAAEAIREKLENLSLTIAVLTHEDEKLYGSITAVDVAAALKEEGFDIDKSFIVMDDAIKTLGIFEVLVNLHPGLSAKIKLWVVKK